MVAGVADIVFNKSNITTASFFKNLNNGYTINVFAEKIGEYYYIVRNLAIAILLFVLLYIGIRMAISTVAEQEAKYKKMLQNWAVSLALVFLLHYIIILTFVVNDNLVNVLFDVAQTEGVNKVSFLDSAYLLGGGVVPVLGWPEVIVYVMLTIATVAFLITYIKRVVTLGFLIVISPLITITYSIDKIGDGKSQALNTWLHEFIFSVLIQPFHCVIYIVFVKTALEMTGNIADGLVNSVLAIASILFMMKAEGIIKKIFGLKADSMGDVMKTGTLALGFATGFFKNMGGNDKGKVPEMKGNSANKKTATKDQAGGKDSGNVSGNGKTPSEGSETETQQGIQENVSENQTENSANSSQQSASSSANSQQNSKTPPPTKIQRALDLAKKGGKTILAPTGKFFERYSGEKGAKGIAKGAAKYAFKNGAAAFGAIAGAGLSDGGAAVSTAMAAKGAAEGIDSFVSQGKKQDQAESNQKVFAEAYNDYATEYRRLYGDDKSDEEVQLAYEELMEKEKKEIKSQYELDAYNRGREIMETGEALGFKGSAYLTDTIRKVQNGDVDVGDDYVPKDYSNSND